MSLTCTAPALAEAAKCYSCLGKRQRRNSLLYLLCQWLKKKEAPPLVFEVLPHSGEGALFGWIDDTGVHTTDWDTFQATAHKEQVTDLQFYGDVGGEITGILNCSALPGLINLLIQGLNHLTSLKVDNPFLSDLTADDCGQLSELTLGNSPVNNLLEVSYCPQLTSIDLSNQAATLISAILNDNGLTAFNCVGMPNLEALNIGNNPLSGAASLSLGNLPSLTQLQVYGCNIGPVFDFSVVPSVEGLYASTCNLVAFDVSQLPVLNSIEVERNLFVSLDVSAASATLSYLDVAACALLESLNLTGMAVVSDLFINQCPHLVAVDVSDCTNLQYYEASETNCLPTGLGNTIVRSVNQAAAGLTGAQVTDIANQVLASAIAANTHDGFLSLKFNAPPTDGSAFGQLITNYGWEAYHS